MLIALGGGSCIDAAKGVAILSGNGGRILDYGGVDLVAKPIPPLLMIPSTSGTGADVSQFCIVTDTDRSVKITIMGRALVPDISITDPRLLMTMPEWLNAATGLDALTHGIEAFVSLAHNPLADIHALNAVGLVCQQPPHHDHRAPRGGRPLEDGAGQPERRPGVHQRDPRRHPRDEPPGRWPARRPARRRQRGAAAARDPLQRRGEPRAVRRPGPRPPASASTGCPPCEAAEMLAVHVRELADDVGVPRGLRALGVDESDVPRLALNTLDDACLTTNPRSASSADVEMLFLAAL